jgi:hypothetical protein
VNQAEALLIIDTGCEFTTLDGGQLRKLGLIEQHSGARMMDLAARKNTLRYTRVDSITLGDFNTGGMPVGVVELEELRSRSDRLEKEGLPPLLGFLGPEVFYRGEAIIDCSGRNIYLKIAGRK